MRNEKQIQQRMWILLWLTRQLWSILLLRFRLQRPVVANVKHHLWGWWWANFLGLLRQVASKQIHTYTKKMKREREWDITAHQGIQIPSVYACADVRIYSEKKNMATVMIVLVNEFFVLLNNKNKFYLVLKRTAPSCCWQDKTSNWINECDISLRCVFICVCVGNI